MKILLLVAAAASAARPFAHRVLGLSLRLEPFVGGHDARHQRVTHHVFGKEIGHRDAAHFGKYLARLGQTAPVAAASPPRDLDNSHTIAACGRHVADLCNGHVTAT